MKKIASLLSVFALAASALTFAAPIALPQPQKNGGMPLFEALSKRSSAAQKSFAGDKLSLDELSTILWAATGKNREPKGWTVPMAMGKEPYTSIYVLLESGAYLYNWDKNELSEISGGNIIRSAVAQDFAKTAPCVLVFVDNSNAGGQDIAALAAGAMSQNVYLAAEALGLKGRFLGYFDGKSISNAIKIKSADSILGVMVVGKQ